MVYTLGFRAHIRGATSHTIFSALKRAARSKKYQLIYVYWERLKLLWDYKTIFIFIAL